MFGGASIHGTKCSRSRIAGLEVEHLHDDGTKYDLASEWAGTFYATVLPLLWIRVSMGVGMSTIRDWLAQHGLVQLMDIFEREQIDLNAVLTLSEADLKELGLPVGLRG